MSSSILGNTLDICRHAKVWSDTPIRPNGLGCIQRLNVSEYFIRSLLGHVALGTVHTVIVDRGRTALSKQLEKTH